MAGSSYSVTLVTLLLLALAAQAPFARSDPAAGVLKQDSTSTSSSSASASAEAAAAAGVVGGGPVGVPPGPVVPPIIPGIGGGAGIGFNKHLDFNAGAGIGPYLAGLFPGLAGLGGGMPPITGDPSQIPPFDPAAGGGFLGMPGFLGAQYIPQSWFGSALAAKGDLLFPITIFLFVVIGVIVTVKFLLALLVPLVAKKFALMEALGSKKFRRSTPDDADDASGDVPKDPKMAHKQKVDQLTQKILPATEQLHQQHARHQHDDDGDSDDEMNG